MLSIAPGENVEARHFMDDEHQITIGIARHQWPRLQRLANQAAEANGGRPDPGAEWDRLNGWILRRLSSCPRGVAPHAWVALAADALLADPGSPPQGG